MICKCQTYLKLSLRVIQRVDYTEADIWKFCVHHIVTIVTYSVPTVIKHSVQL